MVMTGYSIKLVQTFNGMFAFKGSMFHYVDKVDMWRVETSFMESVLFFHLFMSFGNRFRSLGVRANSLPTESSPWLQIAASFTSFCVLLPSPV